MSVTNPSRTGWALVVVLLLLNTTATLVLSFRLKEVSDFLIWFAVPSAAEPAAAGEGSGPSQLSLPQVAVYYNTTCPVCQESTPALLNVRGELSDADLDWDLVPVAPAPFVDEAAYEAGLALVCVKEQGEEWALVAELQEIGAGDVAAILPILGRLGVNREAFDTCLGSADTRSALWQNRFRAAGLGIDGTPAIVAGGAVIQGAIFTEPLRELLYTISGRSLSGG